jgi:hypothetical protein
MPVTTARFILAIFLTLALAVAPATASAAFSPQFNQPAPGSGGGPGSGGTGGLGQLPGPPAGTPSELTVDVVLSDVEGTDLVTVQGAGASEYAHELGRAVGDALGLDRGNSRVVVNDLSDLEEFPMFEDFEALDFGEDILIESDDRISSKSGNDYVFDVDGDSLSRIANQWGFSGVVFGVCAPDVPVTDESQPEGTNVGSGCYEWAFGSGPAVEEAPSIELVQSPSPSSYWLTVGITAGVSLLLGIVFGLIAFAVRRKHFPHLSGGAVGVSVGLGVLALVFAVIAAIVFGFAATEPFRQFTMWAGLGVGGNFVATVAPSFLVAIPFLVPAVVFTRAKALEPVPAVMAPAGTAAPTPSATPESDEPSFAVGDVTPPEGQPKTSPEQAPQERPEDSGNDKWHPPAPPA